MPKRGVKGGLPPLAGTPWLLGDSLRAEPVLVDLPRERVAVDAELLGGPALVAIRGVERVLDEARFERAPSFIERDAPCDHRRDEAVEQVAQVVRAHGRSCPVSRRNASRYLARVRST